MKLILDSGSEYEISSVKSIDMNPGDIVVFRSKSYLSNHAIEVFIKTAKGIFPDNKCLVLEEDMDIEILRQKVSHG